MFSGADKYLFSSEKNRRAVCFAVMVSLYLAVEQVESYSSFSFKAWKSSKQSTDARFMLAECAKNAHSGTKANWHKLHLSLLFNTLICQRNRVISNQQFLYPVWLLNWKTETVNQLFSSPVGMGFFFFFNYHNCILQHGNGKGACPYG